jgi:hypothetical protein
LIVPSLYPQGHRELLGLRPEAARLSFPKPHTAGFWSKKSLADRIAISGNVTKIISGLRALRNGERGDQVFVIGHSFVARIAYAATAQTLIAQTCKEHPGKPGAVYKQVRNMAERSSCSIPLLKLPASLPWIVFPAGRRPSPMINHHSCYRSRRALIGLLA